MLTYSYDSQGRRISTAVFAVGSDFQLDDPERITHYGYDVLGRLASVIEDSTPANTSDDPQVQTDYSFDLAGRLDTATTRQPQSASSRAVITDYDYDALGRLDVQTDRDESNNVLASYDYTVRADGKRTALQETTWFDANEDGVVDPGEQKTTTYNWTYDNVGRLTDEVINHWDDTFDQTEKFIYDLTGNRRELSRDKGNDNVNDEVITYVYDANDRLLEESLNDLTVANDDTTTTYGYDHTQQTSKTVASALATRSSQLFTYNLQGRMSSVVNEGYTDGALSSRERTRYEYDSKSYRVALVNEVDSGLNHTYTPTSSTQFLADHHNHTGYTQTIRETTTNADGSTKTIDYTFGLDEIAQRVVERDDQGALTSDTTHIFGHDGHGSVRVLYDLTTTLASVAQAFTFAAYGQLLAVHGTAGAILPATAALTSLGYSGEHFDAKAQQQYLRARWYNPANGQFNRLDPFAGNMQDPQSLHKYAYVHGDPVNNIDPSGEVSQSVIRMLIAMGTAVAARIFLGLAAEYTLREAYRNEVNNSPNVQTRGEQIGRQDDEDLPGGAFHPSFILKPDILDKDLHKFYEIKPDNPAGRALGASQLVAYEFALARRFPDEIYLPGSWNTAGLYVTKIPAWLEGVPFPGLIITRRVAPGLLVYDQNFLDLQAMAWGLAAYAAAPHIISATAKLAAHLGKTPEVIGRLGEAVGRAPGLAGARPAPAMSFSFSFSVSFSFGFF